MSLGERLKKARKARGFSQEELASKIGSSRGVITNIEHNKIDNPQSLVLNAVCNALNISQDWLITGNGSMEIHNEVAKNVKILSEIYDTAKELSTEEQLYILDLIKSYMKHIKV